MVQKKSYICIEDTTCSAIFERELKHYVNLLQLCLVGIAPIWFSHSPSYQRLLLESNTLLDTPHTKEVRDSLVIMLWKMRKVGQSISIGIVQPIFHEMIEFVAPKIL